MVSQALKKYKKLISEMPLSEHSSTSEKRTWKEKEGKKGCKDIKSLFDGEKPLTLSREDVFRYAKQAKKDKTDKAMKKFIYATLVWGWPTGSRGRNIKNVVDNKNIKKLVKHLNSIPWNIQIGDWQDTYRKIKDIKGLGPSAYTKLLYFLKVSIDKHPALILDKKLIEVFNRKVFKSFNKLENIRYDNAMDYTSYLEQMHKVGKELKLGRRGAEKLERFLHVFGSNIKTKSLYR